MDTPRTQNDNPVFKFSKTCAELTAQNILESRKK
jgi:hypothetical protein